MATFYRITVPNSDETGREWAKRMWDVYSFDYDLERCTNTSVLAWAYEVSDDELRANLDEFDIEYEVIEVDDPDAFDGLPSKAGIDAAINNPINVVGHLTKEERKKLHEEAAKVDEISGGEDEDR